MMPAARAEDAHLLRHEQAFGFGEYAGREILGS
jgi:hypothetical protein